MSIKSAEEYREEAHRVRAVAMKVTSRAVHATLLGVATHYDELARHVEMLAAAAPPPEILKLTHDPRLIVSDCVAIMFATLRYSQRLDI